MFSQGCKGRWFRTDRCLIDVHRDMIEGARRSTSKRDGPGMGAQLLGQAAKDRCPGPGSRKQASALVAAHWRTVATLAEEAQ